MSEWDEHKINQEYERMLENEWERYNEEGEQEEYDPYTEADMLYDYCHGK